MTPLADSSSSQPMAYREKRAWVSLVTLAAVFGAYLLLVPTGAGTSPDQLLPRLGGFAAATIGWGLVYGAGLLLVARRTPAADRGLPDERDRAIEWRAANQAYYLMMGLLILVGMVLPFTHSSWEIVRAALFAFVLAEGCRMALVIRGYRGARHG